jgi:hypothetical protein
MQEILQSPMAQLSPHADVIETQDSFIKEIHRPFRRLDVAKSINPIFGEALPLAGHMPIKTLMEHVRKVPKAEANPS